MPCRHHMAYYITTKKLQKGARRTSTHSRAAGTWRSGNCMHARVPLHFEEQSKPAPFSEPWSNHFGVAGGGPPMLHLTEAGLRVCQHAHPSQRLQQSSLAAMQYVQGAVSNRRDPKRGMSPHLRAKQRKLCSLDDSRISRPAF